MKASTKASTRGAPMKERPIAECLQSKIKAALGVRVALEGWVVLEGWVALEGWAASEGEEILRQTKALERARRRVMVVAIRALEGLQSRWGLRSSCSSRYCASGDARSGG